MDPKSQLYPLEVNPSTGEPFLSLKSHPNIIITPPRLTDIPLLPSLLNDPTTAQWLKGPPLPYLLEHSQVWVTQIKQKTDELLQELQDAEGHESLKVVGNCPVRYIREVKKDGTDVLIGDIELRRCEEMELAGPKGVNWDDAPRLLEINNQRKAGDPEIVWSVGYFLATSHAGQGIMTSAFNAILKEWAIPRMGMRRMVAITNPNNYGSQKVMKKTGFVFREMLEKHIEGKGKKHDIYVFELNITV
ncbi:acyl-CoA N-acyltransferase [Gymnopus androsaceus JB14]|uniref:Acyl-CoA N-acyltransferase n=1 Tax=Gymnopus androsaceus JB14 TaxID=1447944 RepID=A0A6A4IGQ0_9AGAR|nr:acyl-CoA N-acyltransferase [Gymnopus androsaceus JB14]